MATRDVLPAADVDGWLDRNRHWRRDGNSLRRDVEAPSFPAGIDLVVQVARLAEDRDHHPDIDIRWRTVTFRLSTHSAGGITRLDLEVAEAIDALT